MTKEQISTSTLWKATAGAFIVGLALLVTAILPAEYNLDPTGVGKALGLIELSPDALAKKEAAISHTETETLANTASNSVKLSIAPKRGVEYKMTMAQGQQVDYKWATSGDAVYVDMHGEPKGNTTGYFKSYTVTTVNTLQGSFIAPFDGSHGWYFRNDSNQLVEIQLSFSGQYQNPRLL